MTFGARHLGGAAYAGAVTAGAGAGGGVIADPSRPDLVGYRWQTRPGTLGPFGVLAYGGGGAAERPAAGGLSVEPDADLAVIRLAAWWSGAPYLRLVRIVDGVATPVRGAYPLAAVTATRRNRCTNPSFEADLTGWVAGPNTTITRILDAAAPAGAAVGQLRATAAGTVTTSVPGALSVVEPAALALALRLSAAPSGALTATATWQSSTGDALPSTTATVPASALAGHVGGFTRTPVLELVPPATAAQATLALSIAGMPAAATADLDAVLLEHGTAAGGDYFDGGHRTGAWAGAADLTESTLAAALAAADPEAPLDVEVRYELTAPDMPGFTVTSEPVVLGSGNRSWLSHPDHTAAMQVVVEAEPEQTYPIAQGVFAVHGRARPVVVSASVRGSAGATLKVATARFADRDQLRGMLADGSPLLLRHPARLGHGHGEWLAVGDVAESVVGHGGWERTRHFTLPYRVVDPPALPATAQAAAVVAA